MSEHYAVISVDGHCGADLLDYRPYLDSEFHEEFDAWAAKYTLRYGDAVTSSEFAHRNWDSALRLAETEQDGVVAEVLYPNTYPPFIDMGPLSMQPPAAKADYERMWAGIRAHNRWLADFCAQAPGRRAGISLILLNDPEEAIREIRWARAAGLNGGVLLPGIPPGAPISPLHSADYEPVWAVCEELQMPLNHHPDSAAPPIMVEPRSLAMHIIEVKWFVHRALWHLIFSGAFQRHPGLTLVLAEQGADWIPGVLDTLDYYWERFRLRAAQEARFGGSGVDELPLRPSEYWTRNCYTGATFMRPTEVAQRDKIGVGRIMWGQDYPHPEGTFPFSREALRHTFSDVSPTEVRAMVTDNACRVFGFDAAALGHIAERAGAPTMDEVRVPLDKIPDGATCPAFANTTVVRSWLQAAMETVRVLGLGGSLRPGSRSRLVLEASLAAAAGAGAETMLWAVDEEPLPFYRPQDPLEAVTERFLNVVREADAYLWCTPAYHGTVSAPVKNLLDHIDALRDNRPPFLAGKVVGVAAVGEGTLGPVQAVGALVQAAHALRAFVVPLHVPVSHASRRIPRDQIEDQAVAARLADLGRLVVATSWALLRASQSGSSRMSDGNGATRAPVRRT